MTKEEVEQAFNGLSPYYAYKQGLQDGVALMKNLSAEKRQRIYSQICCLVRLQ